MRNSLTEKCENCTTLVSESEESKDVSSSSWSTLTIAIKLEHDDRSACSSSSQRQVVFNFGIPSATSKSTARTSASSFTRSGRVATTRHCNRCRAWSRFGRLISRSTRSYVSSKDSGNSPSVRRKLDGRQCRRTSNWQNTHLNLLDNFNKYCVLKTFPLTFHRLSRRASRSRVPYLPSSIFS